VPTLDGTRILPSSYDFPAPAKEVLEIAASPGEYESASFVLRAGRGSIQGGQLIPGDLTSQEGNRIPARAMDLRVVKVWFQGRSAWVDIAKSAPRDFTQVLVPELLVKDDSLVRVDPTGGRNYLRMGPRAKGRYVWINPGVLATSEQVIPTAAEFPVRDEAELQPFDLAPESVKQFWITFHIPADAAPGQYTGSIHMTVGSTVLLDLPVRLNVHAFRLLSPGITYSVFYRAQLDPVRAGVGSEYRSADQIRLELEDLLAHGVVAPTMYQLPDRPVLLEASLAARRALGMNSDPLFYLGIQTTETFLGSSRREALRTISEKVPLVLDMARRYGFPGLYIYGRDEAEGMALAAQVDLWRAVHDAGGRMFVAGYSGAYDLVGDDLDTLVYYGQPTEREAQLWHSSGHTIFSYANPQSGPENPYLFRLNYGVVLWANNYNGAMPYAYQHCFGHCWNDVDHPIYRDHNFTYPTADGVVPTLAWEGLREAVDDMRYIRTLEARLATATSSTSAAAITAHQFLSDLRLHIRNGQGRPPKYNAGLAIDLDKVRRQVVTHINALDRHFDQEKER